MTLFEIGLEYRALADLALNEGEDNETIKQLFAENTSLLGDKLDNTMKIIKQLDAEEKALKDEAKRLTTRADTRKNKRELLRGLMLGSLETSGEKKLKTMSHNYSITDKESVQVLNEDELPREYVRLTRSADKTKIKEHLKEGVLIDGCSIVKKSSLGVR